MTKTIRPQMPEQLQSREQMSMLATGPVGRHMIRKDFVFIGLVLVIALLAWGGVRLFGTMSKSEVAFVTDATGATHTLPLNEDARLVVNTGLGANTVVVSGGAVHIEDADCKNHDCMMQGEIDQAGEMLICLPHELTVEIRSASDAKEANFGNGASDEDDASNVLDGVSR